MPDTEKVCDCAGYPYVHVASLCVHVDGCDCDEDD